MAKERDGDAGNNEETEREPEQQLQQESQQQQQQQQQFGTSGTVLEAAFVDPSYQWPPPDGVGKNAIELQASVSLVLDDNESVKTTESEKERMTIPENPATGAIKSNSNNKTKGDGSGAKWWNCCRGGSGGDTAIIDLAEYEKKKRAALKHRKKHYASKKARAKQLRMKNRYNRVPEGILIYRLDTATQSISLMSDINDKTDTGTLIRNITITSVRPSSDKSRRGMILKGIVNAPDDDDDYEDDDEVENGSLSRNKSNTKSQQEVTLVACEQRTAIAWLEAIDLMLANKPRMGDTVSFYSFCQVLYVCTKEAKTRCIYNCLSHPFLFNCCFVFFPFLRSSKILSKRETAGIRKDCQVENSIRLKASTSTWPVTRTNLFELIRAATKKLVQVLWVCITASKTTTTKINLKMKRKYLKRRRWKALRNGELSSRIRGTFIV